MCRQDNHKLPNLSLPARLLATAALLLGWLLFSSAWLASVVVSGWGLTLSAFVDLGALLGSLHSTTPTAFWGLFGLHAVSLLLLNGVMVALMRRMALPRGFRAALVIGGRSLAALDLIAWLLLPYSGLVQLLLAPLLLLETALLLLGGLLPSREMWGFTRWRGAERPQRVVIVGGGFGGLYTAMGLDAMLGYHRDLEVTLVDKNNFFLFPPLLPSVATGAIETRQVSTPFRRVFEATNVRFRKATVEAVDLERRSVRTCVVVGEDPESHAPRVMQEELEYDYLVLAPGSTTNTFRVPGAEEHAFFMRRLGDAVAVRNHIIDCFEHAASQVDPELCRELLRFVVVGAGPTGVELAAEVQDLIQHVLLRRYPEIHGEHVEVYLIQSGKQVLPGWHEAVAQATADQLRGIHVKLVLDTRVTEVGPASVTLKSGEVIAARTVVWCTGVKPAPVMATCGLPQERDGKIKVEPDLRAPGQERVFVLGDVAACLGPDGQPLPALAQVAVQQGQQTAGNLSRLLRGKATRPFKYLNYGALICVGEHYAVVDLMGLRLRGFVAWFIWRTLYLSKLVGFGNRVRVVLDWTLDLLLERSIAQIRSDRAEPPAPAVPADGRP